MLKEEKEMMNYRNYTTDQINQRSSGINDYNGFKYTQRANGQLIKKVFLEKINKTRPLGNPEPSRSM